jgi:alginate O-acetyltransferase complex protein AlgI
VVQSPSFWMVLVVATLVYWRLPVRWRMVFLFTASFGYLATLDLTSVLAVLGWTLLFYFSLRMALHRRGRVAVVLIFGVSAFLAYFKYLPPLLTAISGGSPATLLIVPLGISYFTFKLIHYAIERVRGTIQEEALSTFLAYMFLFPIFTAGPIQRYDDFLSTREERWDPRFVVEGTTRIVHGLIKKFFFAEFLLLAFYGSTLPMGADLEMQELLFVAYLFIYLDFSAYTDLAIGSSRLFGFRIMENFNFPIIAGNISDFWRRWHISLSSWCQSYVYLPIMGATRVPYLAALGTFLVIGLWHAATFSRLAWGLFHFAGVAVFMTWSRVRRRRRSRAPGMPQRLGGIMLTQTFVAASMAFILAEGGGRGTGFRLLARLLPGFGP